MTINNKSLGLRRGQLLIMHAEQNTVSLGFYNSPFEYNNTVTKYTRTSEIHNNPKNKHCHQFKNNSQSFIQNVQLNL